MKEQRPPGQKGDDQDDKLPLIGEVVLVQCAGYRCMAFRDEEGKWRDHFHKTELAGPVQIVKWIS